MFYYLTRQVFKKAFLLFYQKITIIGKENIPADTAVILALNHPNSFMDAMLVAAEVDAHVTSLTRGDAFNNKYAAMLLNAAGMIPVYRISEGKENISKNFETFNNCQAVFNRKGTVLIFAEGLCKTNWQLRPFKKGVARIALQAWQQPDTASAVVIPVGLTYQHYKGAGKSMIMNFGAPISINKFEKELNSANFHSNFNETLRIAMEELIYKDDSLTEGSITHQKFVSNWNSLEKKYKGNELLLKIKQGFNESEIKPAKKLIPSAIHGTVILIPHYVFCNFITKKFTRGTVFHDSVLFGLLVFLFPVYLLILVMLYLLISHFV